MFRDSKASHIHLKKSHHVLYISNWVRDKLPFDPIDNPQIQSIENEQDISAQFQPATFGSVKSHKTKQEPGWKDLDIYRLIDDEHGYVKETGYDNLLKKLEQAHDMDRDTFDHPLGRDSPGSSFINESSFANSSSSSLPNIEIAATPDPRNRSAQRNPQDFQTPSFKTPSNRIMR